MYEKTSPPTPELLYLSELYNFLIKKKRGRGHKIWMEIRGLRVKGDSLLPFLFLSRPPIPLNSYIFSTCTNFPFSSLFPISPIPLSLPISPFPC